MKTALVLSAGGMFGAYEAGAWEVLAERFQPDMVIGASVGALNGWAIAGGCPSGDLVRSWQDAAWAGIIHRRLPFLPVLDPEPLRQRCRELVRSYQPRLPFAAAAVAIPRLRRLLLRGDDLDWRHLMASCSVPGALPPVRIDGTLLVDGGFLGALPLWAAAEMGATRVVAIDALPRMPSRWVRGFVRTARLFAPARPFTLPELYRVRPAKPLGSLHDMLYWKAENIARWIEQGRQDALSPILGV